MTLPAASFLKKNPLLKFALLGVVVLVVAWLLLFRSGIDKALVRQKLDEYAAMLQERGRANGRDVSFTYSDVEVEGGLFSRHAVVHNPSVSLKPLEGDGKGNSIVISTPEMLIYPESRDLSAMRLSLPQPVNFAAPEEPEKSLLKITSSSPFDVTVAQTMQNKVPYTKVAHKSPESLDFTFLREQRAEGAEDATPEIVPVYDTIVMNVASGSTLETSFAQDDSDFGKVDIAYGKISMLPKSAPEGVITVDGVNVHWSYGLNNKGVTVMENKSHVGPITGAPDVLPYAPIELTIDGNYQGIAMSADKTKAEDAIIALRKLELSTKESTLTATADFTANPADILPVGKAHVKLTNTPFVREQLQKRGVLTPEKEEWVAAIVKQVTGTAFDQVKDIELPIERSRGGAFKIGNSTFEEVFALVLKQALKAQMPGDPAKKSLAPALPDATKPKPAAIPVPDSGTRG